MDKEKIINAIEKILSNLTLYRLAVFSIFITFLLTVSIFYENRNSIMAFIFNKSVSATFQWTVSEETKLELINLTKSGLVGAILVTEVDFKKNQRITKFFYIDNPNLFKIIKSKIENLMSLPFFNDDSNNNEQMISMLNGQFICNKTEDTIFEQSIPGIKDFFPYVCRISIPPFIGEFTGILTVGLIREPSALEIDVLRISLSEHALNLYNRDIKKDPRFFQPITVEK